MNVHAMRADAHGTKSREQELEEELARARALAAEVARERDGYKRLAHELERRLRASNMAGFVGELQALRGEVADLRIAVSKSSRNVARIRTATQLMARTALAALEKAR